MSELANCADIALIEMAVGDHLRFKRVAAELEGRKPPVEHGALRLIELYRGGAAPPWLTAHLLGCIGHRAGYATVLEILRAAPGLLAESYAGVAAVRIAGTCAFEDLIQVMDNAENLRSREGAAYGLASSRDEAVAPQLVRALQRGRIRPSCGAATLADVLSAIRIEAYLRTGEDTLRHLALLAVFHALARGREDLSAVRAAIAEALEDPRVGLAPIVRERLTAFAQAIAR
jgi:hypothetical protein